MCDEVARRIALNLIREDFNEIKIRLWFPEGFPNLAATDSIRITDTTAIIRAAPDDAADLVQRRWSRPSPNGKPVYNYRSKGRSFANSDNGGRCLIPVDGFYEFTKATDPKAKRKDKWLFSMPDAPFFCIAGLWRADPEVGEAFTMLTCEPGPDIAPYHSRQIVLMPRACWAEWLGGAAPAAGFISPAPAGTLTISRVKSQVDK